MNKVKKKFAQVQITKADIFCQPEVFVLGCFFEPSSVGRKYLTKYLREKIGSKATEYLLPKEILMMCYDWFQPSVEYKNNRIVSISDRFWNSKTAGTMAHKLPTIRSKDICDDFGVSDKTARVKMLELSNTGLVKSYIDEAKAVNNMYTKIRYVQLNVPMFLSIAFDKTNIGVAYAIMKGREHESKFFESVCAILGKAVALSESPSCIRNKVKLKDL